MADDVPEPERLSRRELIGTVVAMGSMSAPAVGVGAAAGDAGLRSGAAKASAAGVETGGGAIGGSAGPGDGVASVGNGGPGDAAYWRAIAGDFDLPAGIIQLENGNWGAMARPVLAAFGRKTAMVNRETSFYSRRGFAAEMERVRGRVAGDLGVAVDEIAFTRGATESLQSLISGYNRLRAGDQVLYADLDYDSMQAAFRSLRARRGVEVVTIALPEPATHQGLIDAYTAALTDNPKVRLMLLTHVSHRTGLVMPVREIVAMARARGVDTIVDSAHAWGQLNFRMGDLGADFVGLTCQKWIGAPMGTGVMFIKRDRLDAIDRNISEDSEAIDTVQQRVHTGTVNLAALLTVEDALDYHRKIGVGRKEARLRSLRDRWAEPVRGLAGVEVLTPADPRLTCAITSFRLAGRGTPKDARALAKRLLDQFGIYTVDREGMARGAAVRVTPGLFTSEADIDRLAAAVRAIAAEA